MRSRNINLGNNFTRLSGLHTFGSVNLIHLLLLLVVFPRRNSSSTTNDEIISHTHHYPALLAKGRLPMEDIVLLNSL